MIGPRETDSVAEQLAAFFACGGYVRRQCSRRLATEGYRCYKKGDEVRFVITTRSELATLRRMLRRAGFNPGRAFAKHRKFVLPVYGRDAVRRLLDFMTPGNLMPACTLKGTARPIRA